MKVLVTGGTGFIGSHLIERIRQKGHEVICIAKDRLNVSTLESLNVRVILGDLNNGVAWNSVLHDVDHIYHLAGVVRAQRSRDYYEGNYEATKHFVKACARHCFNLKRFVYVSSLAAVGPSVDGKPVTEKTAYHPVSHYGKSKMMGELEVLRARDRLPITIVRPSAVYGPREQDMYQYFRLIQRGLQPLIGFKNKLLSLIHSDDLVSGVILAAEHSRSVGETYLLGSENAYSTEEIGNTIARVAGCHPIRLRIPHATVYIIGAAATLMARLVRRRILFNLQKARESVQPSWTCSIEKAKTELGFHQVVSLYEGMCATYQWYRKNSWL